MTKIIPKGKYGEAWGYRLTDGKFEVDTPQEEPIGCCGCGNWELIEKNLIEEVDGLQWSCLDANNNLTFGKYKGMNVEDIKNKDEDYFKWAWANVGGLSELFLLGNTMSLCKICLKQRNRLKKP